MNILEVKNKKLSELLKYARAFAIEGAGSMSRQELVYALLQAHADKDGEIWGEGVIETRPEGFGFLRSADYNYLPGPDDIYVSPSQIRRFNLRTATRFTDSCAPRRRTRSTSRS